ncbi:hypothetical protein EOS_32935 [Caballeronia mineralivorans PML1(12)]|uniref:Uncharacterized protein n=1 Tax=Caballeronia mineralivorans PML1(12) TaxID=908627 RepID=A0A0J1CMK4_9BURK|nr:hypothetical protein [Caballeronia mineralivorans]KLU21952.1 hypothetical protein EOS_32935 [Caballeronia mineralivorans PML1(12)]
MSKTSTDWTADVAEMDADIAAQRAAGSNVVPLKAKAGKRPTRRPVTRVWDEAEVAKRALDLYALERTAVVAYDRAIERAEQFKESRGLERVDHKDPDFRRFTAKTWDAHLSAKAEVKLSKDRLTTACRNCLGGGAPVRTASSYSKADIANVTTLHEKIVAGTISMQDALAVKFENGSPMITREVFLDISRDETYIPF